jgi:hypothetical protein
VPAESQLEQTSSILILCPTSGRLSDVSSRLNTVIVGSGSSDELELDETELTLEERELWLELEIETELTL